MIADGSGARPARLARLAHPADPIAWRDAARALLADDVAPERVIWQVGENGADASADLFAGLADAPRAGSAHRSAPRVPRAFPDLVADVVCHTDERRFALLYRALWRLTHGEPRLLGHRSDADVHALEGWAKTVRRDRHKMTAFVRFRRLADAVDGTERYAAWFEPEHRIVRSTADFFRRRFASMAFSIFTPEESVHWDARALRFGPGATRRAVPEVEAMEDLWREYYASIFNPARLKLAAMRAEMPRKYWKNLPEAAIVPALVREAGARTRTMVDAPGTRAPGFAVRAGLVGGPEGGEGAETRSKGAGKGPIRT